MAGKWLCALRGVTETVAFSRLLRGPRLSVPADGVNSDVPRGHLGGGGHDRRTTEDAEHLSGSKSLSLWGRGTGFTAPIEGEYVFGLATGVAEATDHLEAGLLPDEDLRCVMYMRLRQTQLSCDTVTAQAQRNVLSEESGDSRSG